MGWLNTPVIVIAIIAVAGLVFGVGKWVGSVNTDRNSLKDNAKEDRTSFRELAREIREDIKKILGRLSPVPVTSNSPLELTDFGRKLSNDLKAEEWAINIAQEIVFDVADQQPFQIDEYAEKYVRDNLTEEMDTRVAVCAYEAGTARDNVLQVLRVVLRDELILVAEKLKEEE